VPSDLTLKTMNAVHRAVRTVTFGKLGWTGAGMPVVELTTTGRKSGEPRTVLLTSPTQLDGNAVIVASRGGDPSHPAWFLNLRDNPAVTVKTQTGTSKMKARILTSEERAEVWPTITAKYKNYGEYQMKTEREIPLIVLEPV
jgi:deazaflavin-dependent oxidoreductase (nitroreductase family)